MKKTFIIRDWAGNHCFLDKEFADFDSAWAFLLEKFTDTELQEYYVEEII